MGMAVLAGVPRSWCPVDLEAAGGGKLAAKIMLKERWRESLRQTPCTVKFCLYFALLSIVS